MFRPAFSRMFAVGAAAAALLVGSALPAVAVETGDVSTLSDKTLSVSGGYIKFIDDGDVFQICDTASDGQGVYGELWYGSYASLLDYHRVMTISDGGDGGCDKKGYNIGNGGKYVITLCWGRYAGSTFPSAPCNHSAEFNE
jgi:hypothetical protein